MKVTGIDGEREFNWGRTSTDYARFRQGYPGSFFDTLSSLGVGCPTQEILDLGTGTGVLARAFAARGASVVGVDISAEQIEQARKLAASQGVSVEFHAMAAEQIDYPPATFDVVSAGQSWLYFDRAVLVPKVLSILRKRGRLVLTSLLWLPKLDETAHITEELVLKYNPDWSGAGYDRPNPVPSWSREHFDVQSFCQLREPIQFTREQWRGRIRACRGIGASLSPRKIAEFDSELASLLGRRVPDEFTILHEMLIYCFVRKGMYRGAGNRKMLCEAPNRHTEPYGNST